MPACIPSHRQGGLGMELDTPSVFAIKLVWGLLLTKSADRIARVGTG
ncbi:MAG: hypothetical protein HYW14_04715 [Planctomycetes bacterium]|nr:hypothetical protein [Planctomycetota bacterium]